MRPNLSEIAHLWPPQDPHLHPMTSPYIHNDVAVDVFRALFWQNENIDWWYRQNTILYVKNPAEAAAEVEAPPSPNLLIHPALFAHKKTYIQVQNKKLADIFKGRRSVGFYFRLLLKSMKNRVMDALGR